MAGRIDGRNGGVNATGRSLKNPGGSRCERRTHLRWVPDRSKAVRRRRYRAYRGGATTLEMPPRRRNPQGAWGLAGADLRSLRSLRLWPNTASLVVEGTARSVVARGIDSFSFLVFHSQDGNRRDSDCRARPTRVIQQPAGARSASRRWVAAISGDRPASLAFTNASESLSARRMARACRLRVTNAVSAPARTPE